MNPNQEQEMMDFTSGVVSDSLEGGKPVMVSKVIVLVQYMNSEGVTFDGWLHAGEPRYTEILGSLATHTVRVNSWYTEAQEVEEGP